MTLVSNVLSAPSPEIVPDVGLLEKERNPINISSTATDELNDRPDRHYRQQPGASIDRLVDATIARMTGGLSPAALAVAYWDWAAHLGLSPGKQTQLLGKAAQQWARLARQSLLERSPLERYVIKPCVDPLPQDKRFAGGLWKQWPYSLVYQSFLLQQQWWHNAVIGVPGVTKQHENVLEFASRQALDMLSPSNFLATNPLAQRQAMETRGASLMRGCPSSDNLRLIRQFEKGGSGSSGVRV